MLVDDYVAVNGIKRGACNECECRGYQGKGGPCETCGHFPNNHRFKGVSQEALELEAQKKKQAQIRAGIVGTPLSDKDMEESSISKPWEQKVSTLSRDDN
jgi:hypothetical protein